VAVITVSPGTAAQVYRFDLGACYPNGTAFNVALDSYLSASWPGHTKQWDGYLVCGSSQAALDAAGALATSGGGGSLASTLFGASTDSTGGAEFAWHAGSQPITLNATSRYLAIWWKPRFSSGISWYYRDDLSVITENTPPTGPVTCPSVTIRNFGVLIA
jgi:hypothetical protein